MVPNEFLQELLFFFINMAKLKRAPAVGLFIFVGARMLLKLVCFSLLDQCGGEYLIECAIGGQKRCSWAIDR
jgi:hypothetical protein